MVFFAEATGEEVPMLPIDGMKETDDTPTSSQRDTSLQTLTFLLRTTISTSRTLLFFLIPSFISTRLYPPLSPQIHRPSTTAWLDGIRGWAAYAVVLSHTTGLFTDNGYGWGLNNSYHEWWRLPILHAMVAGTSAVCLFFVVSGFALSIKPLRQMRSNAPGGEILSTMASATLRRPVRLFVPIYASTFIVFVFARLGAFEATRPFLDGLHSTENHHVLQAEGFWENFWHYLKTSVNFSLANISHWSSEGAWNAYDPHLWTVPLEFRASLVLFLTQLGLVRVRDGVRMAVVVFLCLLALGQDWWYMLLFWSGMLICEVQMVWLARVTAMPAIVLHGDELTISSASTWTRRRVLVGVLHALNAVSALWLLSIPDGNAEVTPGFVTIMKFVPPTIAMKYRFWSAIGAMQLVAGAAFSTDLPLGCMSPSAIFSSPLSRYMGDISYAIYMAHGMVTHIIGVPIFYYVFNITGREGSGLQVGMVVSVVLLTIPLICVADVFWRAFDRPSVHLARKFEEWVLK